MANIFPKWTNWLPIQLIVVAIVVGSAVVFGVTYYFTNKYTNVGYMPTQPVPFDHSLHVTQLGMDCRYCHTGVEVSSHSNVPNTQTCMNCHSQVQKENPKLAAVHASWSTGQPIPWIKIHKAPDYVYFNHSVHVNRGISCASCHGPVNHMEVVYQHEPQSMGWCLDCHRAPEKNIRPLNQVFNLDWKAESPEAQLEMGKKFVKEWNVNPPTNCAGCHR